jgi:hypothetical protein
MGGSLEVRRQGDHPPGSLSRALMAGPPGECVLKFEDRAIIIERADPHVWLEDNFLRQLVARKNPDDRNPTVTLTYQPHDLCDPQSCCQGWLGREGHSCFYGAVVTIWGRNEHVSYRIGQFRRGHWEARWA